MTHVLMLSMDATLFTGARGDARARHVEYARRAGSLDVVVCTRGPFAPINDDRLRLRASQSRSRLFYLWDGYGVARQLAAECRPGVITSQDPFLTGLIGLRLRKTFGVPLIVQDHTSAIGSSLFSRESIVTQLLGLVARHVIRHADVVRVVNSREREACLRLGISPDRIHVIPASTDLSLFSQPNRQIDWRERLGIGETEK